MKSYIKSLLCLLVTPLVFWGCKDTDTPADERLFLSLPADESGVDFVNTITPDDFINILTYEYLYNGGGVGIGDFNNDGFQDIFFAGS